MVRVRWARAPGLSARFFIYKIRRDASAGRSKEAGEHGVRAKTMQSEFSGMGAEAFENWRGIRKHTSAIIPVQLFWSALHRIDYN